MQEPQNRQIYTLTVKHEVLGKKDFPTLPKDVVAKKWLNGAEKDRRVRYEILGTHEKTFANEAAAKEYIGARGLPEGSLKIANGHEKKEYAVPGPDVLSIDGLGAVNVSNATAGDKKFHVYARLNDADNEKYHKLLGSFLETRNNVARIKKFDNQESWPEMEVVKLHPFAKDKITKEQSKQVREMTKNALTLNYKSTHGWLRPEVRNELEERAKLGAQVHFLDAGPGNSGWGIRGAQEVSPNVIGHGLGLNYPESSAEKPRGRWIRRHFESTVLKQKEKNEGFFDVIQDRLALMHAFDKAAALQNMLNSLRPGGVLISYSLTGVFVTKPLEDELAKQGITVETNKSTQVRKFYRNGNAEIDLKDFVKNNQAKGGWLWKRIPY